MPRGVIVENDSADTREFTQEVRRAINGAKQKAARITEEWVRAANEKVVHEPTREAEPED